MGEKKIRIMIVDDHNVVRKGLASLLSAEKYGIEVVGEAANGDEAIRIAGQLEPDIILMDLVMPGKDGIEVTQAIKQLQPDARILVLTSFAEDKKVMDALQAGAYGFLLKDTSPDELVQAINSVYAGQLSIPQSRMHVFLGRKATETETASEQEELTPRELDVLRWISKGLSNKQIAQQLTVSTPTVRTHVSSMMRKLQLENRTQLAIYAREHGLT
jgi:NarL family two-component system response regulator LiaR